ncbi:DUF4386 domain-containing protein [Paenibacillus sp. Marseille-P2973]|uniref:DUF4386 domain-containing protein n=1 Tax=Paenibacillus sp. Marseille-P2973 TaxID=1871032 RepID=UPI001B36F38A|nr:DUF4386 domain-containing protein [Paenibacillus sp. Marseille-P2973]MBQ4901218.1 DUF4386 domain-containing protein [Paenibacillus sp. Marseille-P2973]
MKRTERVVGALFLLSTCSFLIGSGMLEPILHRTDLLVSVDSDRMRVFAALFLELINAIAVVGIAMLLQPTLKKYHEAFAFGYFASRVMESSLLMISLIGPLILLALSKQSVSAGTSGDAYLKALGNLAVEAHYLLFDIAMLVLSLGSLLFCYILYRSRLVPRLLSIIGLIGYTGLLASSSLSVAGLDVGEVLYIPGAIFEIALPVWLIVKGFNRHTQAPAK